MLSTHAMFHTIIVSVRSLSDNLKGTVANLTGHHRLCVWCLAQASECMDKYLCERIALLSLRSPPHFHASCEWFGFFLDSCALIACQRAPSSIDGRVLMLAGMVAEFALTMMESRQALVFMPDDVMCIEDLRHSLERRPYSAFGSLLGMPMTNQGCSLVPFCLCLSILTGTDAWFKCGETLLSCSSSPTLRIGRSRILERCMVLALSEWTVGRFPWMVPLLAFHSEASKTRLGIGSHELGLPMVVVTCSRQLQLQQIGGRYSTDTDDWKRLPMRGKARSTSVPARRLRSSLGCTHRGLPGPFGLRESGGRGGRQQHQTVSRGQRGAIPDPEKRRGACVRVRLRSTLSRQLTLHSFPFQDTLVYDDGTPRCTRSFASPSFPFGRLHDGHWELGRSTRP